MLQRIFNINSLRRILLQTLGDEVQSNIRYISFYFCPIDLFKNYIVFSLIKCFAEKWMFAQEALIEDDSKAPHVGLVAVWKV